MHEHKYPDKILVLGDENSGKSCFLARLTQQIYQETQTQFHDVTIKHITLRDISYKFRIWELSHSFYSRKKSRILENCDAIILTVDLTNRVSFDNLKIWMKDICTYKKDECIVVLAATKSDLPVKRVISHQELTDFVKKIPEIRYFDEISSRNASNVEKIFTETARHVISEAILAKSPSKKELCGRLEQYIKRVEQDYTKGFWFFRQSRSINREANCFLAKQLKSELESTENSIGSIFRSNHITDLRNTAIAQNSLFSKDGYVKRGINSSELNDIFKQARKLSC